MRTGAGVNSGMARTHKQLPTWLTVAITLILGILVVVGITPANASPIVELIQNGEFGTDTTPSLNGWAMQTGTASARASTDPLNSSTGNAGFNGFFTSSFAALGNAAGDIGGAPFPGSSSIFQTFFVPVSGDMTISFRTVFDGKGEDDQVDIFRAFLYHRHGTVELFSQNSSNFPTCGPATTCDSTQLVQDPFSRTFPGLPGLEVGPFGFFTLEFRLDRIGNAGDTVAGNTAAGIDSVSAAVSSSVPEPDLLLLLGASFVGVGLLALRARCADTQSRRAGIGAGAIPKASQPSAAHVMNVWLVERNLR
jgi:hypothetical protein